MPRIAELKWMDGAVWARVDVTPDKDGSVSLWTDAEERDAKRKAYEVGYNDAKAGVPPSKFYP